METEPLYQLFNIYLYKSANVTTTTTSGVTTTTTSAVSTTDSLNPSNLESGSIAGNLEYTGGYMQSGNFVSGTSGWRLDSNGNIEANNGYFRGDITGATGTFSGSVSVGSINIGGDDATSCHIDTDGNFWTGASVANKATAPARIDNDGAATFTNVAIGGAALQYVITNSGIFSFGDGSDSDTALDTYSSSSKASYAEANYSSSFPSGTSYFAVQYQSFTPSSTSLLKTAKLYLKKAGSPTGNATVSIYATTGTLGTTCVPTGTALATSANLDVSTLTESNQLIEFTFSTATTLTAGTSYALVFTYSGGSVSNYVDLGVDDTSPSHEGNYGFYNAGNYTADNTVDIVFYVYGKQIATTTLTADKYYDNLTVGEADIINPAGYRLFVQNTAIINGKIKRNGNNGGNGGAGRVDAGPIAVSGVAGEALADGYLKGSVAGGTGSDGYTDGNGNNLGGGLTAGTATTNSLGLDGSSGGGGGSSTWPPSSGSAGAAGGVATASNVKLIANWHLATLLDISSTGSSVKFSNSGGGGGGGGGAGGLSANKGGGGGGGGSSGGIIAIYAKNIVISATGSIEADGGNGGNGGTATQSAAGGGGGGAGGNGGIIVMTYNTLVNNGTISAAGGNGGIGGLGNTYSGQTGSAGGDGNDGSAGIIYQFQLSL